MRSFSGPLHDTAQVQPGHRVLIPAGAGGVGHLAIQVAKALGAYVITTASAAKHAFVAGLGADEIIDYTTTDVSAVVSDVDVALGLIGTQAKGLLKTLRPGGLLITLTSDTDPGLGTVGLRVVDFLAEPDHAGLLALSTLVAEGKLKVHVSQTFPLAEAAAAHIAAETSRTTGKIVLV